MDTNQTETQTANEPTAHPAGNNSTPEASPGVKTKGGPIGAIFWAVAGIGLLIFTGTNPDVNLIIIGSEVIRPEGISFGWLAIAIGAWKFIKWAARETQK